CERGELGRPPCPSVVVPRPRLAGGGWGGGGTHALFFLHAPSLSLPRKRGRGRRSRFFADCGERAGCGEASRAWRALLCWRATITPAFSLLRMARIAIIALILFAAAP